MKSIEIDMKKSDDDGTPNKREWVFTNEHQQAAHMAAEPWELADMKPTGADLKVDGKKVSKVPPIKAKVIVK